jgi:hypothetical protein
MHRHFLGRGVIAGKSVLKQEKYSNKDSQDFTVYTECQMSDDWSCLLNVASSWKMIYKDLLICTCW